MREEGQGGQPMYTALKYENEKERPRAKRLEPAGRGQGYAIVEHSGPMETWKSLHVRLSQPIFASTCE